MATISEMLAQGENYRRTGAVARAEQTARAILQAQPDNVEALRLLAVSLHAAGRLAEAVQPYEKAFRLDPTRADVGNDLGTALAMQNRLEEAIAAYRTVVQRSPGYAEAHCNLGNALRLRHELQDAAAHLTRAVQLKPDFPSAHYNLGLTLFQQGQTERAIASLQEAIRLCPTFTDAQAALATALDELGKPGEATANSQDAISAYRDAIARQPDSAEAYNKLGLLLRDNGRPAEGVILLEQAVRLKKDFADAHNNLGLALMDLGRPEDAIASYEQALRLLPTDASIHNNVGAALVAAGRLDEALGAFQLALWLRPDHVGTHWHRAVALLQTGKFEEGWREYEWRWKSKRSRPRDMPQPRWDGSSLPDRTILLYCEQGLGDAIQFVRYAQAVKERVGTVQLECTPSWIPLLSTCPGIDRCVPAGEPLPPHDVQAPLLSLPAAMHANGLMPMDEPYLTPDSARVALWRQELERYPGFKIGIAWQGNPKHRWDRHRSFPLFHFLELARMEGVQLFSLQKDHGRTQIEDFGARERVVDLGSRMDPEGGLSDVAAVMQTLDLVITCDSGLAHLAGALARPVWIVVARPADWRWLVERTDSPWYPTARLFRQRQRGNWAEVFDRIQAEVEKTIRLTGARTSATVETSPVISDS